MHTGRKVEEAPVCDLFSQRATTPDDLQAALEQALARNEPALIEVPLGELRTPWPYIILPRVRG